VLEKSIQVGARVTGVSIISPDAPLPTRIPPAPPVSSTLLDHKSSQLVTVPTPDFSNVENILAHIKDAVTDMQQQHERHISEWRRAAIDLALAIGARLIHDRIQAEQFPIEALVRDMLAPFVDSPAVTVCLNPHDLALLRERLAGRPLFDDLAGSIRFAADFSLERAACRVEDSERVLISQLSLQLREVHDELLRRLEHDAA
jgi:flagellar biosynthesis/type III secretory pathway protein FliH